MKLSLLTLRPAPGRADALISYYREQRILEESGAAQSYVLVDEEEPETVTVAALWSGAAEYESWLASPRRAEFAEGMADFFDETGTSGSRSFRVAHVSEA